MWIKGDVLLKDIEKRINFWDDNHLAYQQGDSIKVPFDKHIHLFDNKKVLEIGPGEGRQYEVVCDIVKEYAIADISQKVLNRPLYNNIKIKLRIESYLDRFEDKFDVIHFWYVLHHVLPEELSMFIDFLYFHLDVSGIVMFNTPYLDYDRGNYLPNGIMTSVFSIKDIEDVFVGKFEFIIKDKSNWRNSNGYLVIGRKI